jgi:phage/plasmid primase-like uncharacterized protein
MNISNSAFKNNPSDFFACFIATAESVGIALSPDDLDVRAGVFHKAAPLTKEDKGKVSYIRNTKVARGGIQYDVFTFKTFRHGGVTETVSTYPFIIERAKDNGVDVSTFAPISAEKLAEIRRKQRETKEREVRRIARDKARAARAAKEIYGGLSDTGESDYLNKKRLDPKQEYHLRFGSDGIGSFFAMPIYAVVENELKKPAIDLVNLQKIYDGGQKLFLPKAQKKAAFGILADKKAFISPEKIESIAIAEGFATAAAVHTAGLFDVVIVALDAGNLLPAAMAATDYFKNATAVIAADNDIPDEKGKKNTGIKAAAKCRMLGIPYVRPTLPSGAACDFSDVYVQFGAGEVAHQLRNQIETESNPDLLGKEIVLAKRPKTLKLGEAVEALDAKVGQFFKAGGTYFIKATAGIGKTEVVLTHLANIVVNAVLATDHARPAYEYYVPSLALGEELLVRLGDKIKAALAQDESAKASALAAIKLIRGRSAKRPGGNELMCERHQVIAGLESIDGLNMYQAFCKNGKKQCPHYKSCKSEGYLSQFGPDDDKDRETYLPPVVVIKAHAYLPLPRSNLERQQFGEAFQSRITGIIIDESAIDLTRRTYEATVENFEAFFSAAEEENGRRLASKSEKAVYPGTFDTVTSRVKKLTHNNGAISNALAQNFNSPDEAVEKIKLCLDLVPAPKIPAFSPNMDNGAIINNRLEYMTKALPIFSVREILSHIVRDLTTGMNFTMVDTGWSNVSTIVAKPFDRVSNLSENQIKTARAIMAAFFDFSEARFTTAELTKIIKADTPELNTTPKQVEGVAFGLAYHGQYLHVDLQGKEPVFSLADREDDNLEFFLSKNDIPILVIDDAISPVSFNILPQRRQKRAELVYLPVERNAFVTQINDEGFNKTTLNQDKAVKVLFAAIKKHRPDRNNRMLVVSYKDAVPEIVVKAVGMYANFIQKDKDDSLEKLDIDYGGAFRLRWTDKKAEWAACYGVDFAHFGALRGKDQYKDHKTIVVIGRQMVPYDNAQRIAAAHYPYDNIKFFNTRSKTGRAFARKLPTQKRAFLLRDPGLIEYASVPYHEDARVQAVIEETREQETLQAIDRLRLVHGEEKNVVIASTIPIPGLYVDDLVTFDEYTEENMDRLLAKKVIERTGGIPMTETGLNHLCYHLAREERALNKKTGNSVPIHMVRLTQQEEEACRLQAGRLKIYLDNNAQRLLYNYKSISIGHQVPTRTASYYAGKHTEGSPQTFLYVGDVYDVAKRLGSIMGVDLNVVDTGDYAEMGMTKLPPKGEGFVIKRMIAGVFAGYVPGYEPESYCPPDEGESPKNRPGKRIKNQKDRDKHAQKPGIFRRVANA